ncbi:MAG: YwbE family protein [Anaerolineaceae bacterium]|nr:YwbE family protein [Anaerolineaceae bacterium]
MSKHENTIKREEVRKGSRVRIVLKNDQATGKLTEGIVKDVLTKSFTHPHGIKVRLENGKIGRVKELVQADVE